MNTLTKHPPRQADVSFTCHLATTSAYFSRHAQCNGTSYAASTTDRGVTCRCKCHAPAGYTCACTEEALVPGCTVHYGGAA